MASILILMELSTRDTGLMTSKTVREKKIGQTVLNMKAITRKERSMVTASSSGLTDHPTMENSVRIRLKAAVGTLGLMVASMTERGTTTRCMAKACSAGLMEESTRASISMIRKKVMVCLLGQMEGSTTAAGSTVNKKALECISMLKERPDTDFGMKGSERSGSRRKTSAH